LSACTIHREYLAAIADGEVSLVPKATLEHVEDCADCTREIQAHRLLSSRLRGAADILEKPTPPRRDLWLVPSRARMLAGAVAAAVLVAAGGVGWYVLSRPDPVQAAVNAASEPMQIESSDPVQVGQWCLQASGKNLPVVRLDGMQIDGARMDRIDSNGIVTVAYVAPSGARVTVGWLEGPAPPGSGVEETSRSGRPVLIVHSAMGTAVILGSSSEAMWEAAAAIETSAP
jgi:hypothetical protein